MCGNVSGTFALFVELHIHLKSFLTSFLTFIEIMYQVLPPQLFCTVSDEQDLGMRLYVWEEFWVTMYVAVFLQIFYSHWEVCA